MFNSSYATTYDKEVGTFLSDEFTNFFISLIDENPTFTIGDLFATLQKQTTDSHVCYFGDETFKYLPISTFIGTPKKITFNNINYQPSSNSLKVKPSEAAEKTLTFLSHHSKSSIRVRAKLQLLRNKAQTLKLENALDLLVKYVDPKNYDLIMKDSKITTNYLQVLCIFIEKIGEINLDDYGRFNVIKSLAAMHPKEEIIQGINVIL